MRAMREVCEVGGEVARGGCEVCARAESRARWNSFLCTWNGIIRTVIFQLEQLGDPATLGGLAPRGPLVRRDRT